LLGPDRQLLPLLHNRARVARGLYVLLRTTPDIASDLVGALSATDWLGVIPWVQPPEFLSVRLHLDPVPPENSIPLAEFGQVELPLQVVRVRHATANQSLLEMITNAVAKRYLEFRAGTGSDDQYTAVGLAWFGLDPASVPALQAFVGRKEEDNYLKAERKAVRDNRYGCAVLSFPLAALLRDKPTMWKLGERDYRQELSQTVLLLDRTQGVQPAIYESEEKRLTPLAVRASPSAGCP
jgi:hypothetical protein